MTVTRSLAGLVLLLVLSGCADDPPSADERAPATTAEPAPVAPTASRTVEPPGSSPGTTATPPAAADVTGFVAVVRAELPDVAAGRSDDEIAAVAVAACDGLAAGTSPDEIVAQARSLGTLDAEATDDATARELVRLAVDGVCLDQAGRVDEF